MWSRRIEEENRLVHQVEGERVRFLATRYHHGPPTAPSRHPLAAPSAPSSDRSFSNGVVTSLWQPWTDLPRQEQRRIPAGPLRSSLHTVIYALHCVIHSLHFPYPYLRSALLLGPIVWLLAHAVRRYTLAAEHPGRRILPRRKQPTSFADVPLGCRPSAVSPLATSVNQRKDHRR